MSYIGHRTAQPFGKMKIALKFRIQDQGDFYGVELERWYNAARLIGRVGKGGHFKPPARGGFMIEYLRLFPDIDVRRLDRIPFKPFRHCLVKAQVETVTANSTQEQLPGQLQYSVIRKLLEVGV